MTDGSDNLAKKYQKKTDIEHVLDNPDTYMGSMEKINSDLWVLGANNKVIMKNIEYIPALFSLINEGLVNCRDHAIRMEQLIANGTENVNKVTYIKINIDNDTNSPNYGMITMINDGNGIDVAIHPDYNIWIPELIFGNMKTSTNYDKTEKKIVGGKNGFGFKLVLIWSTVGTIETLDTSRGLKYTQRFENNLHEICKPTITTCKVKKPYTKIAFKLDYNRMGIDGLSDDMISWIKRRVYDLAAVTNKDVKVYFNDELIPVKTFQQYIDMYIEPEDSYSTIPKVYESNNPRWEYIVSLTPIGEFTHVSFVNGINTPKGGKHVEYILNQITRKMVDFIENKKKLKVTPNSIKEQLILFLRCDIENPSFDSQTKDYMNTPFSKFGSKCDVSDKFIEKLAKLGIMDAACAITEVKQTKEAKKSDGTKTRTIRGIPKLDDANYAGDPRKSKLCTIILCEGDSAKSGIVSGLTADDRNYFGLYPLRGKLVNTRDKKLIDLSENKEISEIKKIIGLETGKTYKTIEDVHNNLRYGRILFITDQDLDGSHIKGLGINLIQSLWPSLFNIPNFICFMNTPILKVTKGKHVITFYNDVEYNDWKSKNNDGKGYTSKYYKGLGTSTSKEFKEYMKNKKIIGFASSGAECINAVDKVFNIKRADDRKQWLGEYDKTKYLDTNKELITYSEFINNELIHFSIYDCNRNIPNIMDGLKISMRKILFAAYKRNLTTEIKVAQFVGYVSEHACYHHGEASLQGTLIGLAQNFVGSNNISLFVPAGQFGTRLKGGKDAASPRYIFTYLSQITKIIFNDYDNELLIYNYDDGIKIEPTFYVPIVPMILINGSTGIGTGFSTDIMCYNLNEIINYLRNKLKDENTNFNFIPYYEGFHGEITQINDNKYLIKGKYEKIGTDQILVTELPIGFWTDDFKEHLEELINPTEKPKKTTTTKKVVKPKVIYIKDYQNNSTESTVKITITFVKDKLEELESEITNNINGVEKLLKLATTNTNTNMYLFNSKLQLRKYDTVNEIIDDYYIERLNLYDRRKKFIINKLNNELIKLSNKARFINENLEGTIDLRHKTREQINKLLISKKYDMVLLPNSENILDDNFKYLVELPMNSVTVENVNKILNEEQNKKKELALVKKTTIKQMWLNELDILETEYKKYIETQHYIEIENESDDEDIKVKPKRKTIKKTK